MIILAGCSETVNSIYPGIEKGKLDLRQWDFSTDGNIKLDGKWEFYWHRLLMYKDLEGAKPDLYAGVPNTWNTYLIDGEKLPGQGYATYRLHVNTNLSPGTMLGLRTYLFSCAYALYIDQNLVASNGRTATSALEETAGCRPQAVLFAVPADEFDIIIHVSNFHYARGGFWYSLYMGNPENIMNLHDSLMGRAMFIFGTLTIIALFYFALFFLISDRSMPYSFNIFRI